jgi:hypothetical protein
MTNKRFVKSALLCGSVAVLGSGAVLAAPPEKPGATEVTISVVADPDALEEKVNTIDLPAAAETSRTPPQTGNEAKHDKDAGARKDTELGKASNTADDKANNHADDAPHPVGEQGQSDSENTGQDTNEAKPPSANPPEGAGGT